MADKDAQLAAARQEAAVALEALRRMEVGVREAAKAGSAMESEKDKAAGELKEVFPPPRVAVWDSTLRFRLKIEQLQTFGGCLPENPGQNLVLTGLYVPYTLDSGVGHDIPRWWLCLWRALRCRRGGM